MATDMDKMLADLAAKQKEVTASTPAKQITGFEPDNKELVVTPVIDSTLKIEATDKATGDTVQVTATPAPVIVEIPKTDAGPKEQGPLPLPGIPNRNPRRTRIMGQMQKILEAHGGVVSNIPVNSEYYNLKNRL